MDSRMAERLIGRAGARWSHLTASRFLAQRQPALPSINQG